jgi:hypothetical protein
VLYRNPSVFENRFSIANKRLVEPGDHPAGFAFGMTTFDIVVRESEVKRILARDELDRNKISARSGVRIIVAPVVVGPVSVPGAAKIRHGIMAPWALSDPENCRDNATLPAIPSWPAAQSVSADYRGASHIARLAWFFDAPARMMLRVVPDIPAGLVGGLLGGLPMMRRLVVVDPHFEVTIESKASSTWVGRLRRSLAAVTCKDPRRKSKAQDHRTLSVP